MRIYQPRESMRPQVRYYLVLESDVDGAHDSRFLGKLQDVINDDEGLANMRNLGENMAWLLKTLSNE